MKRIIPAIFILIFTISLCSVSHNFVNNACNQTIKDISDFENNLISADQLQQSWQKRKEKMSLFVNHGFLDDISIQIGQLAISGTKSNELFDRTLKNIQTTLLMIKDEQRFSAHSFY